MCIAGIDTQSTLNSGEISDGSGTIQLIRKLTAFFRRQARIMSQQSSQHLKYNNFDLLRLLLSGTVCVVHTCELSGYPQLAWIARILSSAVAVKAFFVISGFLIFMSCERSSSLASYASKRIRRLYPAYFVVVMLAAFGLFVMSSRNAHDYFSFAWVKYLVANLTFLNFLQPTLPGVFESNKMSAVNGALWTLKIEVLFYMTVPVFIFLFRKYSRLTILVPCYCLSVAFSVAVAIAAERTHNPIFVELNRQLPAQLSYFLSGAFLYYFLPFFERRVAFFVLGSGLVLAIGMFFPLPLFEPFALATIVVFCALFPYVGNVGKYGDFSYGTYILHFPVIQILISSGWFTDRPWQLLFAVIAITSFGAIAMWHLVEKRMLLRSSHYVSTTPKAQTNVSRFLGAGGHA